MKIMRLDGANLGVKGNANTISPHRFMPIYGLLIARPAFDSASTGVR